jgi:hypothetical protein
MSGEVAGYTVMATAQIERFAKQLALDMQRSGVAKADSVVMTGIAVLTIGVELLVGSSQRDDVEEIFRELVDVARRDNATATRTGGTADS